MANGLKRMTSRSTSHRRGSTRRRIYCTIFANRGAHWMPSRPARRTGSVRHAMGCPRAHDGKAYKRSRGRPWPVPRHPANEAKRGNRWTRSNSPSSDLHAVSRRHQGNPARRLRIARTTRKPRRIMFRKRAKDPTRSLQGESLRPSHPRHSGTARRRSLKPSSPNRGATACLTLVPRRRTTRKRAARNKRGNHTRRHIPWAMGVEPSGRR